MSTSDPLRSADTGARNERRLAAVSYSKTSGFEVIHGLLDRLMQLLEVPADPAGGYCLRQADRQYRNTAP